MKTLQLLIIVILFVAVSLSINVVFAQTSNNPDLMMVVKTGNLKGDDYQNGTYTQTVEFGGNVGKVQTGQPVIIKIFKNNFLYKTDLITASNFYSDKLFWYQITVTGKSSLDSYKIDFIYGNQTSEEFLPMMHTGIPPMSYTSSLPLSPLKQFKSGISALDVKCNQGLQLILKSEDGFPACVKSDTSQILIKRGWGVEGLVPHPRPAKSSP